VKKDNPIEEGLKLLVAQREKEMRAAVTPDEDVLTHATARYSYNNGSGGYGSGSYERAPRTGLDLETSIMVHVTKVTGAVEAYREAVAALKQAQKQAKADEDLPF